MELLGELRAIGWYLSEAGLKKVNTSNKNDVNEIIKLCLDIDFREIAEGTLSTRRIGETLKGPLVLQVQWVRNISAPKATETSSAPRLLCVELTDGQTTIKALELEKVLNLDLNTPPGTKIRFRAEQIQLLGGYILLRNQEIQVLGGNVAHLVEKWEVAKSMQAYARNGRHTGTTGPPPWVAFGKSLESVAESLPKERNFKSLQLATEKEKETKENEEFTAMRNEAIAEAAKAGTKKVFGGGGQQILDHNVKKILDKGYSEEEARQFLRATNNNLERALYNLKRRQESMQGASVPKSSAPASSGRSTAAPPSRESKRERGKPTATEEVGASIKPVANVSLFDFLTDKLPANAQRPAASSSEASKPSSKPTTTTTQPSTNVTESKLTSNGGSSMPSNQQQRGGQPDRHERGSRPSESNRQQSGKFSRYEANNESNRRERGGGSTTGGPPSAQPRQGGRGNRNNTYANNDENSKRGGGGGNEGERERERGGRKQFSNNQSTDAGINAGNNSTQNSGRSKYESGQNSGRYNSNRNQQRQQHSQQQYNNGPSSVPPPPHKQHYGQRSRQSQSNVMAQLPSQPSSSVTNITLATPAYAVSGAPVTTVVAAPPPVLLPNGFAYDPSKIIGFQTKEANEYAMNLMKSQGKTIPIDALVQGQPNQMQPQPKPQQMQPQPPPIQYIQATAVPAPITMAPQHFGIPSGIPTDAWSWKVGDLCLAKYWDDGQYYEAEITGISDKTCVVYYIGYGNHEEVLKSDCLPITDAHHRPINNYNFQLAAPQPPPPQQPPPPSGRTATRYYVPPHKRNN